VGQFVRFFHLRNIRFDKYGHHKELALKGCHSRYFVGRFSLFNGRLDKFFDCEMALVKGNNKEMKKMIKFFIGSLMFVTILWGCSGNPAERHNSESSGFLDCPDTPNCVSSLAKNPKYRVEPFRLKKDPKTSWDIVKKTVELLPRTKVVSADNSDIHAECRSLIFRFVDDLTLHLTPSNGIIHLRSASRIGYSDLGVNRRRVETLRKKLQQNGIIE
jgi:uncharacterized protein (DUF1499 family)